MMMAVAVTGRHEVAGHFGKAAAFVVFDEQGQQVALVENHNTKAIGCKHKKRIQRQLSDLGVTQIVLGNIGQRSLARLLNAGFAVYQVLNRSELSDVLNEQVAKVPLLAPEQGRPCKREKGECGCGCGSKKETAPKVGMVMQPQGVIRGLKTLGGFKL